MTAIFVTATGTDIGKTYVVSALIRHYRSTGEPVEAFKPVATGFDPSSMTSDPAVLLSALGRPHTEPEFERISPWRFAAPFSPDMAASREQRAIDFSALVDFCRTAIDGRRGTSLIEGIGGVMVPLDQTHTVLDWIVALNIPVLLVTGTYLGTLSHTLTAIDTLSRQGRTIKALIVNETPGSTVPLADTAETLRRFIAPVPIVVLPHAPQPDAQSIESVAKLLAG
jgi:dethiobiotin synthetase